MSGRSATLGSLAVLLVLAGCLGTGPARAPESPSTTAWEPDGTAAQTPTATESRGFEPANESAPIAVQLVNRRGNWVAVRLRLSTATTNETLHEGTHDVAPNGRPWTVAELPRDGRRVDVVARAGGARGRATVETAACWGTVVVAVTESGALRVTADNC